MTGASGLGGGAHAAPFGGHTAKDWRDTPDTARIDEQAGAECSAAGWQAAQAGEPSGLSVSVVVPTYRRPQLLERCLQALGAQSLPPTAYEIVVVDDGCTEDTRACVTAFAERHLSHTVRYVRPAGDHGPAIARNVGWRCAKSALIAFTDDDTVPDSDWLAQGLAAFRLAWRRGERPAALSGRVRVPLSPAERRRPSDHQKMTLGLERAEFVTANAFVQRDALVRIDGFDERFRRAWREDSDLQFRLMQHVGPVLACPAAVVAHPVRPEPWGVSLRQQRNVYFDALLYKKHPKLYRERILPKPPWLYYVIVGSSLAAGGLALGGAGQAWVIAAGIACVGILRFAGQRLRDASMEPDHLLEMLATSALIPFLSIYWRLRGAWHFRVLYL